MTKKLLPILLMLVFLLSGSLSAFADGISDDQKDDFPGVTDYRKMDIGKDPDHQRPYAGFSLQIKSGEKLSEEVLSGKCDVQDPILSNQDSPVIKAGIGDSIVINDRCNLGSGTAIIAYDIQYRFVPKGQERTKSEITPTIVSNFSGVKNIIENLKLEEAGTYEIFMAAQDNAECMAGTSNWSTNGNLRVIAKNNPHFPAGVYWYFTEAVVEVDECPDFYPTPEGSNEWQEEYKNSAKTYTGKSGETITFPVNLYNVGSKSITNCRAVWEGQGGDPKTGWKGAEPFWEAKDIELDTGEFETFNITVKVSEKPTKLYLLANVDGKTPESEVNQDNNIMAILIEPEGVDIEADLTPGPIVYWIKPGEAADVYVVLLVNRNDSGEMPVNVDVSYSGPFGTKTDQATLDGYLIGENDIAAYDIRFKTNKAGTYLVNASAWPAGVNDLAPSNNIDETIVVVKVREQTDVHKVDPDSQTRVNLRS